MDIDFLLEIAKTKKNENSSIDLLSLAEKSTDERLYSKILYTFLRWDCDYNNGNLYCSNFLRMLSSSLNSCYLDNDKIIEVYREYESGKGPIDLLLRTQNKKTIIIENKIFASDQPKQLERYYDSLKRVTNDLIIVFYLTPSGTEPSEFSLPIARQKEMKELGIFSCISYKYEILSWLDKCLRMGDEFNESALIQFSFTIKEMLKMNDSIFLVLFV